MNTLRTLACIGLVVFFLAPKVSAATTLSWKGSGSTSGWITASNWTPSQSPNDGDTLVFSSTTANTSPVANIGDVNLAGMSFSVSGYQIVGAMANSEFCAKSVYASQPSFGMGINCRFRTLFGNAALTYVNSGASLAFNGDFALDSGATVTVAGKGETTINNLTTPGSAPTAISKIDTGTLTLTGSNTAYNTTINASAGTLQIAQYSVQGSTTTVVGVAATLSGGGISGTVINRGTIAPSTSAASIHTLTISGSLTCPLDAANPSHVTFLLGGASPGQYSGLILQGASDFGGSYLQIGFVNNYLPAVGAAFTLGTVEGSTNVPAKAFRSLSEGALFRIGRYVFSITYQGGSYARNIVVTRVPTPAPAIGPFSRSVQGMVSLPINGFSGEVVQVESSPDLQSWSVAQTLTLDSTGSATFTQSSSITQAFFRVRAVDP